MSEAPAVGRSDVRTFRRVLSCFCSGVVVVTAIDGGTPVGLTCQSFSSLSLDPPLIMVAVSRSSHSWRRVRRSQRFAVNILGADQQPVSEAFGISGRDKFLATDWRPGRHGSPLIVGAMAAIECALHAVYAGGDHEIGIGLVLELHEPTGSPEPLLYFRSEYRRLPAPTDSPLR
jgi:3-hydroxy-9,10-secoandrosta-1,3,5(10)-triene-9,17-dione monooxygenase reductase component